MFSTIILCALQYLGAAYAQCDEISKLDWSWAQTLSTGKSKVVISPTDWSNVEGKFMNAFTDINLGSVSGSRSSPTCNSSYFWDTRPTVCPGVASRADFARRKNALPHERSYLIMGDPKAGANQGAFR